MVTYEHYWRGCKNPVYLLAEAKRAKKAQDDKAAAEAAKLVLAEERKKQLVEATLKQEGISAMNLQAEKELLLSGSSENYPVPSSARDKVFD